MVCRKMVKVVRTSRLPPPKGQTRIQGLPLQSFLLPAKKIAVLECDLRKRRWLVPGVALIKNYKFSRKHSDRPVVENQVICDKGKYVVLLPNPEQRCPQYRFAPEIKRLYRLLLRYVKRARCGLLLGQVAQVNGRKLKGSGRSNRLEQLAIDH